MRPTKFVSSKKRPLRVSLLAIGAFLLAAWNGLRLGEALFFNKTLTAYGAHPTYIAVSGAFWLLTGALLTVGLWRGQAQAWTAALVGAAGYTVWYWLDRLALQQPRANWPFALIVTVICFIITTFILFSSKTKQFFRRDPHERKPQDSAPA